MSRDPDPIIDDENPEWTEADFARAVPAGDLPAAVLAAFPNSKADGRAEETELVSLRISRDVLRHFRSSGPDWRRQIDTALKASISAKPSLRD
jgi:uncharacterized protein (DUF4415 family)